MIVRSVWPGWNAAEDKTVAWALARVITHETRRA
ncbi:MAG: hypothetical protein RIT02_1258, partial [Planctomycetota bacterium]